MLTAANTESPTTLRRAEIEKLRDLCRRRLLNRLRNDVDKLYDLAFRHAESATRLEDPAVKMTMFLLGRILPDQKEGFVVKHEESPQQGTKNAIFNFYGVERGTEAARVRAAAEFARMREVSDAVIETNRTA